MSERLARSECRLRDSEKKRIAASFGWRCAMCKQLLPPRYEIDHITPLSRGGRHAWNNLQSLCGSCHNDKTMCDMDEACWEKWERQTGQSRYWNVMYSKNVLQQQ